MGMPSRILKAAIDLRATRTLGFWPAIVASCSWALSSSLVSVFASPTPMFRVIFSRRGASITLEYLKRSTSCGWISAK